MDPALEKLYIRLEHLTSPNQVGRGSKGNLDAIDRLQKKINRMKASKKKKNSKVKIG